MLRRPSAHLPNVTIHYCNPRMQWSYAMQQKGVLLPLRSAGRPECYKGFICQIQQMTSLLWIPSPRLLWLVNWRSVYLSRRSLAINIQLKMYLETRMWSRPFTPVPVTFEFNLFKSAKSIFCACFCSSATLILNGRRMSYKCFWC